MKKLVVLFLLLFVMVSANFSEAKAEAGIFVKKNDSWILAGYNQNVAGEEGVTNSFGPISGIIGGDIGRLFAMELLLGGRIGKEGVSLTENMETLSLTQDLSIFDAKLYLMFQPKFEIPGVGFRPYVGIAPTMHFTQVKSTMFALGTSASNSEASLDFGFAAKAGLRLQLVKFLMLGVNFEYQFHKSKVFYRDTTNYDMSGFSVGAELGLSF